jgi:anti-sigma factor RsiW
MNCRQLEEHAIAYLDGKLPRNEADAVRGHLAGCAGCSERLRGFSDVSSLLDGWERMQPSASFNRRLHERIMAEAAPSAGWLERFLGRVQANPFGKPALAGALLGMMVIAVVLARFIPGPPTATSSDRASVAMLTEAAEGNDELALYQDLPVLENLELLSNFEVLQELQTSAQ